MLEHAYLLNRAVARLKTITIMGVRKGSRITTVIEKSVASILEVE